MPEWHMMQKRTDNSSVFLNLTWKEISNEEVLLMTKNHVLLKRNSSKVETKSNNGMIHVKKKIKELASIIKIYSN